MTLYTDSRGSNFVEYMIIVGLVALLGIGAFATFGGSITDKLGRQGERVAAMEGRVRSLDSRPGDTAAAENARAEKNLAAKSNDGWASNGEAANASSRSKNGDDGRESARADIVVSDSSPGFDAGALMAVLLLIAGAFLLYRWKKARRAMANMTADATLDEFLAPAVRWMSTVRAHVAGRLPWTPRE